MTKTPQVFLSYAREDRARAKQIYDSLIAEGFKPWMDIRDLNPGEMWQRSIDKALRRSDFVLVLLSNNSINKRGYVQVELKEALSVFSETPSGDLLLIPVRLEECQLPLDLAHFQSVDLFEKQGWLRLLQALRRSTGNEMALEELRYAIKNQEELITSKLHLFVAMPFSLEMEDIYYYGIQRAVDANGYVSERIDQSSFTGSVLQKIRERIETAAASLQI